MRDSSNSKFRRMRIRMPKFSKINSEAQAAFEFEHPEKLKGTQPNHSNSNQQKLMRELSNSNLNTALNNKCQAAGSHLPTAFW